MDLFQHDKDFHYERVKIENVTFEEVDFVSEKNNRPLWRKMKNNENHLKYQYERPFKLVEKNPKRGACHSLRGRFSVRRKYATNGG